MLNSNQFNNLKDLVKSEIARRVGSGPLTKYNTSDYDVTVTPDKIVTAEDAKKVLEPLLAINDYDGLELPVKGKPIPKEFGPELLQYMTNLKNQTLTQSSSTCRGACTGLCVGSCTGACNGCTSSCGSGCGANCTSSCGSGCAGSAMKA